MLLDLFHDHLERSSEPCCHSFVTLAQSSADLLDMFDAFPFCTNCHSTEPGTRPHCGFSLWAPYPAAQRHNWPLTQIYSW